MKLFIKINDSLSNYCERSNSIIKILRENGFETSLSDNLSDRLDFIPNHAFSPKEADFVVSLGGDGTFLRGTKIAIENEKPIIGVNIGRLGYLCYYDEQSVRELTPEFLTNAMLEEERVLRVDGFKEGAVNDIIVGKDYFGQAIEIEVVVNDGEPFTIRGDGVIISTPMGSTGYNYSAGGPLIKEKNCMVITPICAHNEVKPIVIDEKDVVTIRQVNDRYKASVFSDGARIFELKDEVTVRMDEKVYYRVTK